MKLKNTLILFLLVLLFPLASVAQFDFDLKFRSSNDRSQLIRVRTSDNHFTVQKFNKSDAEIELVEEVTNYHPIKSIRDSKCKTSIVFSSGGDSLIITEKKKKVSISFFRSNGIQETFSESYDFEYDDLKYAKYDWDKSCIRIEKVNSNFFVKDKETQIVYSSYGIPNSDVILIAEGTRLIDKQSTFGYAYIKPSEKGKIKLSLYSPKMDSTFFERSFSVLESLDQIGNVKELENNESEGCNYIGKSDDIFLKPDTRNDLRLVQSGYSIEDLSIDVTGGEFIQGTEANLFTVIPEESVVTIRILDAKTKKVLISKGYIVRE